MTWEVAKKTEKGWDFLLAGKTATDLEHYHLLHTPTHPGIDPASVIDELYARAKTAAGGKEPTGPLWRSRLGRPLSEKQVRKRILLALRRCGYTGNKPNILRAAVMSKLIASGVPAPDVARFVHHSLTSTTQFTRYQFSDEGRGATTALLAEVGGNPGDG
jgi:integrase